MTCCAASNADTGRFFSWLAGLHRLRHRLLGFEGTQRHLIAGIEAQGLAGAELLEVGCGPGYLHQHLLDRGAACAVGVDLSERMLAIARESAAARGLDARTSYRRGDFVQIARDIVPADIVILDKAVCCYPDWEAMLDRSLERARRIVALTYPRDRALTRAGVRLAGWGLGTLGCCYAPFVHPPEAIRGRLAASGFERVSERPTALWVTEIYRRRQRVARASRPDGGGGLERQGGAAQPLE